jgi:hypothetical protein
MMRRLVFAAVLAAAFPTASLAITDRAATHYGTNSVVHAFAKAGIRLVDQAPGEIIQVKQFADTPHKGRPWSIAVYIYPNERQASAVFNGSVSRWRASGFAVRKVGNVVVAVGPTGATLAKRSKPFAMPSIVASALAGLH